MKGRVDGFNTYKQNKILYREKQAKWESKCHVNCKSATYGSCCILPIFYKEQFLTDNRRSKSINNSQKSELQVINTWEEFAVSLQKTAQFEQRSLSNKPMPSSKLRVSQWTSAVFGRASLRVLCLTISYMLWPYLCLPQNYKIVENRKTISFISSFMTHVFCLHSILSYLLILSFLDLFSK